MYEVGMTAEMEAMHGFSIMDSPYSTLAWLHHAERLTCQDWRSTLSFRYGTIPEGSGQLSVKISYQCTPPLTDRKTLCSNRDRHKFRMWISLPSSNCSFSISILSSKIHYDLSIPWYLKHHLCWLRNSLYSKGSVVMDSYPWSSLILPVSPLLRSNSLDRMREWLGRSHEWYHVGTTP